MVRTWNDSSSMIRERPKSAMRRSEFSAGVRKSRFSGLRSRLAFSLGGKGYLDGRFRGRGGMIPHRRWFGRDLRRRIHSNSPFDIFGRIIRPQDINR